MKSFSFLVIPALMGVMSAISSCGSRPPDGLAPTPDGDGPVVVFDLENKPLPEIPFPNDLATRPDPSSPTGRRLNMSLVAPTDLESRIRRQVDKMDGFGTFAPIWVSFSKAVDVISIIERHHNLDFDDDAVFLIDISARKGSPGYGKPVFLDMGQGFFPKTLPSTPEYFSSSGYGLYFPYDSHSQASNLLFETVDEDLDGDGKLDPGEDLDFDGVLDAPNLIPGGSDQWDDLMTFYEKESNTLIMRPVVPLRERTTYAVVITRRVEGTDGEPVRSPFPYINHTHQTKALRPIEEILPDYGLELADVAFAWTFTTQSITSHLKVIREGLYGAGPMAYLADDFPPVYTQYRLRDEDASGASVNLYTIDVEDLLPYFPIVAGLLPGGEISGAALAESYDYVDYIVAGEYDSPNFLVDRDDLAVEGYPADDDELFDVDPETGEAVFGVGEVPFICTVPKENPDWNIEPPFPVIIFMHGTSGSKIHTLAYGGVHARHGFAVCGIDGWANGMPLPEEGILSADLVKSTLAGIGYSPLFDVIEGKRTRDLDMDGTRDIAGDFWTIDALHTRDAIRQTVVDLVNFVRIMRSFDGERLCSKGIEGEEESGVCGDFNGDGTVDFGGLDSRYNAWGISLGGIVIGVFAGVEPALDAAVPVSGGGGLVEVAIRSVKQGVPELVVLPLIGPLFIGRLSPAEGEEGLTELLFFLPGQGATHERRFALLDDVSPGDRATVRNLDSGEERSVLIGEEGTLRLQIAADALFATEIRGLMGFDPAAEDHDPPKITHTLGDPSGLWPALGDRLVFEVHSPSGELKHRIESFGEDVQFNGIVYRQGAPLVNLYRGFGYQRQTPGIRRFMAIAQALLESGDPVNWAPHYHLDPLVYDRVPEDRGVTPGVNVLTIVTVGDSQVPLATGFSIARAAGVLSYSVPDQRYGKTQSQVLIENHVMEGLVHRNRFMVEYTDQDGEPAEQPIMFDPDDLDNSRTFEGCECSTRILEDDPDDPYLLTAYGCKDGQGNWCGSGYGEPDLDPPLRATVDTGIGRGKAGLRILFIEPEGVHGINLMNPSRPFDMETYALNLMSRYFISGGEEIRDDPCLEDSSCSD